MPGSLPKNKKKDKKAFQSNVNRPLFYGQRGSRQGMQEGCLIGTSDQEGEERGVIVW